MRRGEGKNPMGEVKGSFSEMIDEKSHGVGEGGSGAEGGSLGNEMFSIV